MDLTKLYITHPDHGRSFHIYGEDHRALCGRSMMLTRDPGLCTRITAETGWVKGQDCKACFRKAGLIRADTAQGET